MQVETVAVGVDWHSQNQTEVNNLLALRPVAQSVRWWKFAMASREKGKKEEGQNKREKNDEERWDGRKEDFIFRVSLFSVDSKFKVRDSIKQSCRRK